MKQEKKAFFANGFEKVCTKFDMPVSMWQTAPFGRLVPHTNLQQDRTKHKITDLKQQKLTRGNLLCSGTYSVASY